MKRSNILKNIIQQLHDGESVDQVKDEFKHHFKDVSAAEIAAAEQELVQDGFTVEEIQTLCDVHATLFEDSVTPVAEPEELGHPLQVFKEENQGILDFLDHQFNIVFKKYLEQPQNQQEHLKLAIHELLKIDKHYTRKENLMFPYLEKAGITTPPKVMWGVDDEIRELLKKSYTSVSDGNVKSAKKQIEKAIKKIVSMVTKENEILAPLLVKHITEEEWKVIAQESVHIGYVFTGNRENASPSDAMAWVKKGSANMEPRNDAPIQLPSGFFQQKELAMLLNTLPCDITFVGTDDKVHFFSEQKERVFPRTRTIIGRDVADCHPPKSIDVVNGIIQSFKNGEKDSETFWIQMGDKFILIRYFAVRDEEGKYLGVLEVTEDIAPLRKLEGEKRLLSNTK